MGHHKALAPENAVKHFIKRAGKYNSSSRWVNDAVLIGKMRDLAEAGSEDNVLDIATGTGKIAQTFQGKVKYVVGVDICREMARQAKHFVDYIILAAAENLPLKNNIFDVCVCRQGLQFMELKDVLSEIHRVLKPGGRIVLCHLTAYSDQDKDESFLIQRLRNPARKNFFLPDDVPSLLKDNAFMDIDFSEHISKESVNRWVGNASISKNAKKQINQLYRDASCDFKKIHRLKFENNDIFDSMRMIIVKARKRGNNA
ncbi:MAG: methyltransferase domain-containing protein [Candidatus Omnitrophica bacterium]|nr:methyltransferase domain-containing protein [Candidatus Omnitrophota bacterium]